MIFWANDWLTRNGFIDHEKKRHAFSSSTVRQTWIFMRLGHTAAVRAASLWFWWWRWSAKNWQKVASVQILMIKMPHRHKDSDHHRHRSSNHGKKPLKASSMATRHKSADSKKLLTKTYSEIGVSSNAGGNAAETPTPSEKVSKWHRDILLVSPQTSQHHAVSLSKTWLTKLPCWFDEKYWGLWMVFRQLNAAMLIFEPKTQFFRQIDKKVDRQSPKSSRLAS